MRPDAPGAGSRTPLKLTRLCSRLQVCQTDATGRGVVKLRSQYLTAPLFKFTNVVRDPPEITHCCKSLIIMVDARRFEVGSISLSWTWDFSSMVFDNKTLLLLKW